MLDTPLSALIADLVKLNQESYPLLLAQPTMIMLGAGAIAVAHWVLAAVLLVQTHRYSDIRIFAITKFAAIGLLLHSAVYGLILLPMGLSLSWSLAIGISMVVIWVSVGLLARSLFPSLISSAVAKNLAQINQQLEQKIAERQEVEQSLRATADQLQQALDFDALLKRITDKVRDSLDEKVILQTAVQALAEGLDLFSCNAALYDLESKTAVVHYEYTTAFKPVQGRVMSMDNAPWLYDQLLTGQGFQFCSLFPNPTRGRVAMLVYPIVDDRGVLGDLWLVNSADYGFTEMELRLMQQVTNQCAIALRQARLYQSAQAQVKELKRLNTLKDDFLSTVSHELRTPVANVKLATRMLAVTLGRRAEALEDDSIFSQPEALAELDQQVRNKELYYLKILEDECQREIDLVNDLLDLQRLDQDKVAFDFEEIDLNEWLPRTIKPFENRVSNREQSLTINTTQPLLPIQSDRVSLGRILTEFLNNACKYTPPGEHIIVDVNTSGDTAEFTVTNTGVEIPAREIPHIFDKFYRVPSTDPWKQGGTGLGLALIKSLTHHLGGRVEVKCQDNRTSFMVYMPLRQENQEEVTADVGEAMQPDVVEALS